MSNAGNFYIDGAWVAPVEPKPYPVINPATEAEIASINLAGRQDVDRAVAAAKGAFQSFSQSSPEERAALLRRIIEVYKTRFEDLAQAISQEIGAPIKLSRAQQVPLGIAHLKSALAALEGFQFRKTSGTTLVVREPIGVCALITPWNWPMNQIVCKVAPALAAGCTVVLKPSEEAPSSAAIFAEILHEAGVPAGVFNLVQGAGEAGQALAEHPDVDMISFTGSNAAGVAVAKAAAETVKRVSQELGGKSANIVLPDADLKKAVTGGVYGCFNNSGQSCNAPTRMFVHRGQYEEALGIAAGVAAKLTVGDTTQETTSTGPVVNKRQFERIQSYIDRGMAEGARVVAGGPGLPDGLNQGYFVRPTVFGDVTNEMTIAREEIFGPVLVVIPYDDEADAVRMANDTQFGLSGYVSGGTVERARDVALQLRTGNVHLNGALPDFTAPFGGYKRSGNGREWGVSGFEEYLETKAILGAVPDQPAAG
jgi:aldehyde dehydrogenase (NAD+)